MLNAVTCSRLTEGDDVRLGPETVTEHVVWLPDTNGRKDAGISSTTSVKMLAR